KATEPGLLSLGGPVLLPGSPISPRTAAEGVFHPMGWGGHREHFSDGKHRFAQVQYVFPVKTVVPSGCPKTGAKMATPAGKKSLAGETGQGIHRGTFPPGFEGVRCGRVSPYHTQLFQHDIQARNRQIVLRVRKQAQSGKSKRWE